MKYKLIKEKEALDVKSVRRNIEIDDKEDSIIEESYVFTDGDIDDIINETPVKLGSGLKYKGKLIDKLHVRKVFLKNYSYILVCKTKSVYTKNKGCSGFYDAVKKIDVYLSNDKDKKAKKEAKKAVKDLKINNFSMDYSKTNLIYNDDIMNHGLMHFDSYQLSDNIYKLKKRK